MPFKNPHPLYSCYQSMKDRCRNPKFKQWKDYGGRGIFVCDRWLLPNGEGFRNFIEDMGEKPTGYVLDRKNNESIYSPENCCWVTRKQSQRNQRVTVKIMIEGVEYVAADIADKTGFKTDTIIARAKCGLTMAEIINPNRRVFTEGLAIGWKYGRGAGNR